MRISGIPDSENWCWKEFIKSFESDESIDMTGIEYFDEMTCVDESQWFKIIERINKKEDLSGSNQNKP